MEKEGGWAPLQRLIPNWPHVRILLLAAGSVKDVVFVDLWQSLQRFKAVQSHTFSFFNGDMLKIRTGLFKECGF